MNVQNIIIAVLVIAAAGAGVWFFAASGGTGSDLDLVTEGENIEDRTGNEATVETGPVARVNGEELTHTDLDRVEAQVAAGAGPEAAQVDVEQQALETLISQTLIAQAADAAGAEPDEAAVQAEFDRISGQFEGAGEFSAALEAEGITEEGLRERIKSEFARQAYLEAELELSSVTVSDEEVAATYEQVAGGEDVPPLEEVRGQVEGLVLQQKQQQLISAHVEELRADADIEILI